MRFTITMLGGSLLLVFLSTLSPVLKPFGMIGALWFFVSIPSTILYWVVRLVRRAWGEGRRDERDPLTDRASLERPVTL